jgi:hypothetical protein
LSSVTIDAIGTSVMDAIGKSRRWAAQTGRPTSEKKRKSGVRLGQTTVARVAEARSVEQTFVIP